MAELSIEKSVVVGTTLEKLWSAFTTEAGVAAFFAPAARIEARLGGRYDLYFAPDGEVGARGSEDCSVVAFVPPQAGVAELAVQLRFPPHLIALEAEVTVAQLRFAREQGHHLGCADEARVDLRHTGFEDLRGAAQRPRFAASPGQRAAEFSAGYTYWNRAWATVLARLVTHFRTRH